MLKRWAAVMRYFEEGELPIALSRRNCLSTGSERVGLRAAEILGIVGTGKLNGLEPYGWLEVKLVKLPAWPYSRIDELLPLLPLPHRSCRGLRGASNA